MTQHLPHTYRWRLGDTGPGVAELRSKLTLLGLLSSGHRTDLFDQETDAAVRYFQQQRGLTADGIVGLETYRHLHEAGWRLGDRPLGLTADGPQIGDDVAHLQQRLLNMGFTPGRVDGIYGNNTAQAVSEFQRNMGLRPDGTLGPLTFTVLERLSRTVVGGAPHVMRETEMLLRSGPALTGKSVVIDPGHGGADHGVLANGLSEAELVWEIAARLGERLTALGVSTAFTRSPDGGGDETQRAEAANRTDANLLISLHVEGHRNPAAAGVASYYYGDESRGRWSHAGKQFAGLVQRELVARCGFGDNRSHARTWTLLRSTRMAAVRIELGYLTNPGDAARISSPEIRAQAVESIAVAVQRLYLPPEDDSPTGVLHLPALA